MSADGGERKLDRLRLDPDARRLRDEMEHHLDELETLLRLEGMSAEAARAEAARRFGDPERIASGTPGGAPSRWWQARVDALRQDLGHAVRQMVRHPLTTGLTIGTLSVGVAATTVVFSVVDAVVLSPLHFDDPGRVVHISQTSPQGRLYATSEPNFVDFRLRQRSFVEVAGMGYESPVLTGMGDPISIEARRVSHTFFSVLGIEPILGRDFLPEEDRFGGSDDVVLLSEGTWRRRFGADENVVGRTMVLDDRGREVAGVVPSDRAWPGVEVFIPLAPNPDFYRDDQRIETIARLSPGTDIETAQRDMSSIAAQLSEEYPDSNDGWGAAVRPAREWLVGDRLTRLGHLLLGSVALFLLMACASVSNLLLARASTRTGEMGVRAALGAAADRLTAQLLTEGMALAAVSGTIALALAHAGLRLVKAFGPGDIARLGQASLDGGALAVALGAVGLTVAAAGLAPATLLTRGGLHGALRSGSRAGSSAARPLRDALVVAQFALAVTVVSGAALLTQSFVHLQEVDLGFDAASVVRFAVRLPDDRFDQRERADYMERLATRVEAVPGVEAVGATTAPPFSPMRPSNFVARSDREPGRQQDFQPVSWRAVTPGYFEAAGIPALAGRTFRAEDYGEPGEPVPNPPVVVDRTLADLLFPGEDPVGRLVTWFLPDGQQCEIIGVVAAARDERLDVEPRPRVYRPFTFSAWEQPAVLVRALGDPARLIPELRAATLAVDASIPAIAPTAISDDVRETVAWPRFSMQVLSIFGLVALALASMGIYGVTAFAVRRRRHEIGVRIALGAEPSGVQWMVVRQALWLAAVGIGGGLGTALLLASFLDTLLYDVSGTDPLTFLLVPVVTGAVAVAATWIPARRAVRLDPREALAEE